MNITLYSTHCPKCRVIEAKLHLKDIPFEECTDVESMEKLGIMSVPVLAVDGHFYQFKEAVDWINNYGGENH